MAHTEGYNTIVAARTRAAEYILTTAELLQEYEAAGGLVADLQKIVAFGSDAEALSHAQLGAASGSSGSTVSLLARFAELQTEYSAIMACVQAVRHDLAEAGADNDLLAAVDSILADETEVVIRTVTSADGAKKKVKKKSQSYEAIRAEILRDATGLIGLDGAQAALTKRKVTSARLKKLKVAAESLAGQLAEQSSRKGASKSATKAVRDAVASQRLVWGACYRLLAAVGRNDERIRRLLKEAAH